MKKFDALTDEQLAASPYSGNYATLVVEYKKLREHHVEETTALIDERDHVVERFKALKDAEADLREARRRVDKSADMLIASFKAEIERLRLELHWRSAERAPFGGDKARTCTCINGCMAKNCDGGL